MTKATLTCVALLLIFSCEDNSKENEPVEPEIYKIPVVVHVLHLGEPVGQGYNLSEERIKGQIASLNDDFRRREGTRGYNTHPDGADARIEFVLASTDPHGDPTNGIVRIDTTLFDNPVPTNNRFNHYAWYSYWDYQHYLNIWIEPFPEALKDVLLGEATGPNTDLPGYERLLKGEPVQAEGVLINSFHFGESELASDYNLGRTLTHEVGHYLGLLHLWGSGDCATNDYCDDTPPMSQNLPGCGAGSLACDGQPAMTENYMTYTPDRCMNIFTNDQVERMHYVLKNSPARKSLLTSPGLDR